jgi:hypothetical protein
MGMTAGVKDDKDDGCMQKDDESTGRGIGKATGFFS